MGKSIILAEKPSVGKELARVLNCKKRTKGYCEGAQYVVTWSLGHLVELAEPADYDQKFKAWRLEDLPMMPEKMKLKVIKQTGSQFRTVKELMKRSDIDELIIATDAGREGELVARWIMRLGGWKKPFRRLWISSQTDAAIKDGFENLKAGKNYDNLYHAAQCRAEADWLVGLNVTRALTCKHDVQLSAGRVQTPTLAMIVNREKEIQNFNPIDYWTIKADFDDYIGSWQDKNGNRRIFDREKAEALAAKLQGKTGTIIDITTKQKSEQPPLAYDLAELQRDANRQYSFSAKQTLSLLQRLYERHKLVTYPRTDSRYITKDMVATLPDRLKAISIPPYQSLVAPLLKQSLSPGKRFVNDSKVSDHHAIIPTEQPVNLSQLTNDERLIHDLIVKRFLTVLYPPYKYDHTTITTEVEGELFISRGKVEKELGWKTVTQQILLDDTDSDDDEPEDQPLAAQENGVKKEVKNCRINQLQTKPPARYTEATLLAAMESPGKFIEDEELRESIKSGGLGTPATRADIIEKILGNYYVERNGKQLVPTDKGIQLIEIVPPELKSPELTAKWELRLSDIEKGNEDKRNFMKDIRKNAIELVRDVKQSTLKYQLDPKSGAKCPICGKAMMPVKDKKNKKWVCLDRRCAYEEIEGQDINPDQKPSRKERQMNKRLIAQYSDKKKIGTNLGDLLKEALENKED